MITKQEIIRIAKLAKLEIPDGDLESFTSAFSEIIAFADTINREVTGDNSDIREVPSPAAALSGLRGDVVEESLPAEKITSPVGSEKGYFTVRRVVK